MSTPFKEDTLSKKTRGQRGLAKATHRLLELAAAIARARGPISVRGVAYALFVAKGLSSMAKGNTDKVSHILVYGREHGIIEWADILFFFQTVGPPRILHFLPARRSAV